MVYYLTMINYEELITAIKTLERHQKLYKVLKAELSKKGHWKQLPRGKPRRFNHGI